MGNIQRMKKKVNNLKYTRNFYSFKTKNKIKFSHILKRKHEVSMFHFIKRYCTTTSYYTIHHSNPTGPSHPPSPRKPEKHQTYAHDTSDKQHFFFVFLQQPTTENSTTQMGNIIHNH